MFYEVPCYSDGTPLIVTIDPKKKYIQIYQPLHDIQTQKLNIADTNTHTIYTYEKCKVFCTSKHTSVTTIEPLFSSEYDSMFIGMHNHTKDHIGKNLIFMNGKKYIR